MSNQRVTNKQVSVVTLAPLLDVNGDALVLRPKGTKGDEREVDAETARHEIIERVRKAGWIDVRPVFNAAAQPPQQPPAPVAVTPPTPPPAPSVPPAPAPEPVVAAPVVPAPEAAPEPAPAAPPVEAAAPAEEHAAPVEAAAPAEEHAAPAPAPAEAADEPPAKSTRSRK